jgi:DNA-binding MarR family transcriptional regulator
MIDKMSNASRLVEKLKKKGLVERESCQEDRRRVNISITEAGLELLTAASCALEKASLRQLEYLNDDEAALLNELLDRIRTED